MSKSVILIYYVCIYSNTVILNGFCLTYDGTNSGAHAQQRLQL